MKMLTSVFLVAACLVLTVVGGSGDSSEFSAWSDAVNLGPVVNSAFVDNTPCISRDGLSLYFYSTRSGNGDLYVSQRPTTSDPWGTPVNLATINNTDVQEYWPALSPDGHRLYFSRFINHDGNSNYDLFLSRRHNKKDAFGWETAVPVSELNTIDFNDVALEFFEDESTGLLTAYFTSNRSGNPDLFMTWLQDDDTFALPTPVTELNTALPERLATIRRDGLEVFFNRALPGTTGSGPIFTATRSSTMQPWSAPVPVAGPINLDPTQVSNLGPRLSFGGTELYFSSTRGGGSGLNDIWVSTRTKLRAN